MLLRWRRNSLSVKVCYSSSMFTNSPPLFLPTGSVRAVLALGIVASAVAGLVDNEVLFLVLGFYFGSRTAGDQN